MVKEIDTNKNIFDKIIKDQEYLNIVEDILNNKIFQRMNNYIQHGTITTLEHSINVSYYSYLLCKKMNLDYISVARAGLLHDFFLYDWHIYKKETHNYFHGITHPIVALKNATQYFELNDIEKDCIKKHMFPLTIIPPKYIEGYIIMLIDKKCAILEYLITK